MKTVIIVLSLLAFVAAFNHEELKMRYRFSEFVEKHNKKYSSNDEFMDRLKIFTENVKDIEAHNNRRELSWTKGINQFSDLTGKYCN